MHVTDAERDRVIRELRDQYADDALSQDEFASRVSEALEADSRQQLMGLVRPETSVAVAPAPAQAIAPADRQCVEPLLAPGEWIEWTGHPDTTKRVTREDLPFIAFGALWLTFAAMYEGLALLSGQAFTISWGIPFLAFGLYLSVGRFYRRASRRRRTTYAVTSNRVMAVVRGASGQALEARHLRSLATVSTRVDASGRGSIAFDHPGSYVDPGMAPFDRSRALPVGLVFLDIDDAAGVAALIERLRADDDSR